MDAATSCDLASSYTRDLVENQLSIEICHLTEFALLGESWLKTYMPPVKK